jgi:ribosomal protein S18 acetylase RimI-like enzyme
VNRCDAAIRTADPDEAPVLAELHLRTALAAYADIFPPEAPKPTNEEIVAFWEHTLSSDDGSCVFVAENGPVIGIALAGPDPREPTSGHLSRFYVDPAHSGRGIGTALYEHCLHRLRDLGFTTATLWVLERNARVRSWYERLGWRPTGERKPVYPPGGIDDLRYRLGSI